MSASRSESQVAHGRGRRRSNTAQSVFKTSPQPNTPLQIGDSKTLTTWVHDPKESPAITLNQSYWPGVLEGDILQLSALNSEQASGFLFIVPKDEGVTKHQLQISVPRPVAEKFGLKNNGEVQLTKVDPEKWGADLIELVFQDQYLGRSEMWRLNAHLVGQCAYAHQEISFIGVIGAQVQALYISGKKVSTAYVTSCTKFVYRSLSAKVTMFIQVCRELWDFAGDGERYNEKIVHSFLPALFSKWRDAGTTHILTIVLISRVYYDEAEIEYAAGPLRRDDERKWYKDFFKVITDLEMVYDWKPTLVSLKDSFWAFQRDILLAHHHHRASLVSPDTAPDHVRLVGRLSYAHEGPILEALNLGFNPTETHYIDRSLSLTGAATIIITPGTGYFRVSKRLLRLTTTRMLDQGFAIDLVSLAKPPLHQSPIFAFEGVEPEHRPEVAGRIGPRAMDPLWGGDDGSGDSSSREKTFWWEPFWLSVSFWDKQMDLPFREDRFIARAKMPEIEMLGLLDHDVLSSIELPFLPDLRDPSATPVPGNENSAQLLRLEADKFDMDTFAAKKEMKPPVTARNSVASSGSGSLLSASFRSVDNIKRPERLAPSRVTEVSRIASIQESPQRIVTDLSDPDSPSYIEQLIKAGTTQLSTSPSRSSIRSTRTSTSTLSKATSITTTNPSRPATKSRFTPSWLFSTFTRTGLSQPQTSPVSASGQTSPAVDDNSSALSVTTTRAQPSTLMHPVGPSKATTPKPMTINSARPIGRTSSARNWDDDIFQPHRGSLTRHSPMGTPPRDEPPFAKRWSGNLSGGFNMSASPLARVNPSRPLNYVTYSASSLARRWQHIFAKPLSKHEIKWKSMITPACLPLTVEYFPPASELETSYDVFSYDFVVDPPEMLRSFLVRPPSVTGGPEATRRAWALVVMKGMAALRLAQGFQFVLRPSSIPGLPDTDPASTMRRSASYVMDDTMDPKPSGAAEVLRSPYDPVYLSMSNEIHRISYSQDSIQVRRYVRRMPRAQPFGYKCLIWPKLGVGYTELVTSFVSHGLEDYRWNSLDMLVAGYENQSNESLRYWRTRFVVIPTDEVPQATVGPAGEKLNEEEIRLMGMDKLAELFSKLRWQLPEDKGKQTPPVRFITTDLGPIPSVLDEFVVSQLDDIHAAGPLRKKKNERDVADTSLHLIAKAMREEDGVPITEHRWHGAKYPNSFIGSDLVSWLLREFRDVSTREQAIEWGSKLQEMGLFDHCRGAHGFLDGHYFYALRGEYMVPMTPRGGWFGVRPSRLVSGDDTSNRAAITSSPIARTSLSGRKTRRRLIMSQSTVIDIDPSKRSDQSEWVILHHDIIHNPATCFHFEFQWIGTTARCIDDLLRQWSRAIEKYGLRLVEVYVSQISDIRERNPFQSCFPVPLVMPPPIVQDLDRRVAEGIQTSNYFESALLRKFGFVLDIEATKLYPEQVDVIYSYRRSAYSYSQWVHRSGVAFVQVLGGTRGFLFLTNRLMAPGRIGSTLKAQRPSVTAEEIRTKLQQFCSNAGELEDFYNDELGRLAAHHPILEEPPPLKL